MQSSQPKVALITGISSYIGTHLAKLMLERLPNDFYIRGTLRSLDKVSKLAVLKDAVGEEKFKRLSFGVMDLSNPESIHQALSDRVDGHPITHVVHMASPLNPKEFSTYEAYLEPTRIGTQAMIEAAKQNNIRKLVVTSSFLTCTGAPDFQNGQAINESSKGEIKKTEASGYIDSKIYEEDAFLQYAKEVSDKQTEIVIINPSFVIGPPLQREHSTSVAQISSYLTGQVPAVPNLQVAIVDVRDVAEAHFQALVRDGLHGQRILVAKEAVTWPDVSKVLETHFKPLGYNVQTKVSMNKEDLPQRIQHLAGVTYSIDNKKSRELLGITYERTLEESLVDMVKECAKLGLVENKFA